MQSNMSPTTTLTSEERPPISWEKTRQGDKEEVTGESNEALKKHASSVVRNSTIIRRRRRRPDDTVVPKLTRSPSLLQDDFENASLVGESNTGNKTLPVDATVEMPPLIPQSAILITGFVVFALALVWPPLILLFAYACSMCIPHWFRINDDAVRRRQLLQEFLETDTITLPLRQLPKCVQVEEGYWMNRRYVLSS